MMLGRKVRRFLRQNKNGEKSCTGLLKEGIGVLKRFEFSKFFEEINLINQILSDLKIDD
eukprot:UN13371